MAPMIKEQLTLYFLNKDVMLFAQDFLRTFFPFKGFILLTIKKEKKNKNQNKTKNTAFPHPLSKVDPPILTILRD